MVVFQLQLLHGQGVCGGAGASTAADTDVLGPVVAHVTHSHPEDGPGQKDRRLLVSFIPSSAS